MKQEEETREDCSEMEWKYSGNVCSVSSEGECKTSKRDTYQDFTGYVVELALRVVVIKIRIIAARPVN